MPAIVRDIFENYVKEKFNLKDCIAVNNGTSALIASMWSLGMQPGDEVITTPFTFIATSNAILISGATPIFVDIKESNSLIDENKIEEKITEKTKAIVVVHLFGRMCNMEKIKNLAKKHNLYLIEDTSQSFLAKDANDNYAGMISDIGTFSFYKTKNISTFEGGMICIPQESKADPELIRSICNHGQTKKYVHEYLGFNFRLAEPLCLMAYEQMKLHEEGLISQLGLTTEEAGHYPEVVYKQPAYIKRKIIGNCPIAEKKAKYIKEKYYAN